MMINIGSRGLVAGDTLSVFDANEVSAYNTVGCSSVCGYMKLITDYELGYKDQWNWGNVGGNRITSHQTISALQSACLSLQMMNVVESQTKKKNHTYDSVQTYIWIYRDEKTMPANCN